MRFSTVSKAIYVFSLFTSLVTFPPANLASETTRQTALDPEIAAQIEKDAKDAEEEDDRNRKSQQWLQVRDDKAEMEFAKLDQFLPPRKKYDVLEIGPSFTSRVPLVFQNRIKSYTAVDTSQLAIEKFPQCLHDYGVDITNYRFIRGDALNLPLKANSEDVVYGEFALPLSTNFSSKVTAKVFDRYLSEISRVLRRGGYFIYSPWVPTEAVPPGASKYFRNTSVRTISSERVKELASEPHQNLARSMKLGQYSALVLQK